MGTGPTTVTVTIGGVVRGTYTDLPAGQDMRVYYDLDDGPVIVSSDREPIIAALLDAWKVKGTTTTTSYIETMGLPEEQLSKTYYFPAYNNKTLIDQLRFANVGSGPTTVTVTIGGVVRGTYTDLPAGQDMRVYYDVDDGPVVVSSDRELIIVALLDAWQVKGTNITTSYSQLMGLPIEQVSDTYYFPAYNNKTLIDQLRFGNVGTGPTTVTVTIGGVVRGTYTDLPAGQALRLYYDVDDGPVVVSSDREPIIAALLDAWKLKSDLSITKNDSSVLFFPVGTTTSYVQLMGLPVSQLSDTYYFPAYNNITLTSQLRFGVP